MNEPKALHIWLPDRRSLCDRRAVSTANIESMSDEQFEVYVAEQEGAPVCGPCLLLAGRIRRQGSALLKKASGRVYPTKPSLAWAQLRDTRWATMVDLDQFLERSDLDTGIRFDALNDEVDSDSVNELVEESAEHLKSIKEYRSALKDKSKT